MNNKVTCLAGFVQYESLVNYAFVLTGDRDGAEDAVQDALLAGLRRFTNLDSAPAEYLRACVRHRSLNAIRNNRTRQKAIDLAPRGEMSDSREHDVLLYKRTMEMVAFLPVQARLVALLHWFDGYSCSEIAAMLQVSQKAVEKRVGYARRRILLGIPPDSQR